MSTYTCVFCGAVTEERDVNLIVDVDSVVAQGVICRTCLEQAPHLKSGRVTDPNQLPLDFMADVPGSAPIPVRQGEVFDPGPQFYPGHNVY